MLTKIQKWGNSQGLRLSKNLLEDARISVGDQVEVSIEEGQIIVSPAKRIRGRHKLQDLVACIPDDYQTSEVDWGDPVGREAW